jgi:hypothetical protein
MMRTALVLAVAATVTLLPATALAVCSLPNPVYTGDTKKDCSVCVTTCRRPDWQTEPNTAARRRACLGNNRCTEEQLKGRK